MKILGESENGFIIELSADETVKLAGVKSATKEIAPGKVFSIGNFFERLRVAEELPSRQKDLLISLKDIVNTLEIAQNKK